MRKRSFLLVAFITVVIVVYVALNHTNSSTVDGWHQGPAISVPSVAITQDTVQLVINRDGNLYSYSVQCRSIGLVGTTTIEVKTSESKTSGTGSSANCTTVNGEIMRGGLVDTSTLKPGDGIEVSLTTPNQKQSQYYMVGTDSQLRQGLGSVWK